MAVSRWPLAHGTQTPVASCSSPSTRRGNGCRGGQRPIATAAVGAREPFALPRRYYQQRILAPEANTVQDIVTPDTLDELDRRVYDLAIQHIPLAEMAVRLGVPVAQADEKLQRVFRRLGVEDREALRALGSRPPAPPEMPLPGPNEYVIGGDEYVIGLEDAIEPEPAAERRFSRRAVLGAWAGAAL